MKIPANVEEEEAPAGAAEGLPSNRMPDPLKATKLGSGCSGSEVLAAQHLQSWTGRSRKPEWLKKLVQERCKLLSAAMLLQQLV